MPFIRLVIPFIAGIIIQWVCNFSPLTLLAVGGSIALIIIIFSLLPFAVRYTYRWLHGISINLLFIIAGAFIVYNKDIRKEPNWIGNYSTDSTGILATIKEPLIEKAKTYKAEASVEAVNIEGEWKVVSGNILIYFSKDSSLPEINYGSQVVFYKPLQRIKNSGNPGSFDYDQYCAFQNIYHQIFLKSNEYQITKTKNENVFKKWLFNVRFWVIEKLQQYIKGDREAGVAEALLIGYRNDLDKELVRAYSNTGVVHIIAISGMHLGIIYLALVWLLKLFERTRGIKWIKPVIILAVLMDIYFACQWSSFHSSLGGYVFFYYFRRNH
ncbi:MAG: ComEC family competence protein [Segetibacter sp.]